MANKPRENWRRLEAEINSLRHRAEDIIRQKSALARNYNELAFDRVLKGIELYDDPGFHMAHRDPNAHLFQLFKDLCQHSFGELRLAYKYFPAREQWRDAPSVMHLVAAADRLERDAQPPSVRKTSHSYKQEAEQLKAENQQLKWQAKQQSRQGETVACGHVASEPVASEPVASEPTIAEYDPAAEKAIGSLYKDIMQFLRTAESKYGSHANCAALLRKLRKIVDSVCRLCAA